MPRHSIFELKDAPLHQKGKILRMSKAYTNQDFAKPTVLTDDVFPYVTFFYASHGKALKFINQDNATKYGNPNQFGYEFYWKQAEIFYKAAKELPFEASPVAAYYCMLNAAKSYLAYKSTTADDFVDEFSLHGISEDANDTGLDLDSIMVKHKQKGVFPLFARTLDSDFNLIWPNGQKSYSLKSLLYNLAFVHRAYSMTYTTRSKKVDELFSPLYAGDMPKYYQGNDGKAYLRVELEKEYFAANAQTIPSQILTTVNQNFKLYGNLGFCLISKDGARYNSSCISSELRNNNQKYRRYFSYIRGSKRLWYLKRTELQNAQGPEVINLSDLTINMAAMHRVSEIARYKPEQLNRLMKSKENWLLHEFIAQALDQFIDELAAEITKQDIMNAGQKE